MPHLFTIVGIMFLTHAAYSAATQTSSTSVPVNIIIQALVSMMVTMAGLVINTKLIDIKYTGHKNYDTILNRPSLYTFNHRGKFVYPKTAGL